MTRGLFFMRLVIGLISCVCVALFVGACKKPAPMDRGAALYETLCQSCHGRDGAGAHGVYAPLAGTPVPNGDPAKMLAWVLYGERPALLPRGQFAGVMPQFGFLSDEDAASVTTHVRHSFGNAAAPIDAAMVAAVRATHPGR